MVPLLLLAFILVGMDVAASEPESTILMAGAAAYTITPVDETGKLWEEAYQDVNHNGRYDAPDPSNPTHPHDPFTDENGNGKWDGPYLAGFHHKESYYTATGVHDPLWARALIIQQGNTRVGFLALDLIGFFYPEVEQIRLRVADLHLGYLIVASTHTHGAPDSLGLWGPNRLTDGKDPRFIEHIFKQSELAIREASRRLTPARIRFASIEPPRQFGRLINDLRDPIVIDSKILVMAVDDEKGRAISTVVNWTPHPETLGGATSLITSDFPHYIRQGIEKGGFTVKGKRWRGRGGTTLYFSGAVGGLLSTLRLKVKDEVGSLIPERSWDIVRRIGEIVSAAVLQGINDQQAVPIREIRVARKRFFIPLENKLFKLLIARGVIQRGTYTNGSFAGLEGEDLFTEVGLVSFLNSDHAVAQFVTVPGELFPEIAIGGYLSDGATCWKVSQRKLKLHGKGRERIGAANPGVPTEPVLKQHMRAKYKFIIGLGNDELGYIVPANDFVPPVLEPTPHYGTDRCGDSDHYEEGMSVGPKAAPRIADAIVQLLEQGHAQ